MKGIFDEFFIVDTQINSLANVSVNFFLKITFWQGLPFFVLFTVQNVVRQALSNDKTFQDWFLWLVHAYSGALTESMHTPVVHVYT